MKQPARSSDYLAAGGTVSHSKAAVGRAHSTATARPLLFPSSELSKPDEVGKRTAMGRQLLRSEFSRSREPNQQYKVEEHNSTVSAAGAVFIPSFERSKTGWRRTSSGCRATGHHTTPLPLSLLLRVLSLMMPSHDDPDDYRRNDSDCCTVASHQGGQEQTLAPK